MKSLQIILLLATLLPVGMLRAQAPILFQSHMQVKSQDTYGWEVNTTRDSGYVIAGRSTDPADYHLLVRLDKYGRSAGGFASIASKTYGLCAGGDQRPLWVEELPSTDIYTATRNGSSGSCNPSGGSFGVFKTDIFDPTQIKFGRAVYKDAIDAVDAAPFYYHPDEDQHVWVGTTTLMGDFEDPYNNPNGGNNDPFGNDPFGDGTTNDDNFMPPSTLPADFIATMAMDTNGVLDSFHFYGGDPSYFSPAGQSSEDTSVYMPMPEIPETYTGQAIAGNRFKEVCVAGITTEGNGSSNIVVTKINPDQTIGWRRLIETPGLTKVKQVIALKSNHFAMVGSTQDPMTGLERIFVMVIHRGTGLAGMDMLLASGQGWGIVETHDGDLVVTGRTGARGNVDVYMARIGYPAMSGSPFVWEYSYGGDLEEYARAIAEDPFDHSLIAVGDFIDIEGDYHLYVLKVDSMGDACNKHALSTQTTPFIQHQDTSKIGWYKVEYTVQQPDSPLDAGASNNRFCYTGPMGFKKAPIASENEKNLSVYPNPVRETLHLDWQDMPAEAISYRLHDVQGRVLRQGAATAATGKAQLDLADVPAGMYMLRFVAGTESYTRKIVVR